jgi:sodium/bile acid cotransporter 7
MSGFTQSPPSLLPQLRPDRFTLALLLAIALASLLPATGGAARAFGHATTLAIGALFFLHGARLSKQAALAGLAHWRLHLLVLACTFVMFPLLGLLLRPLALALLGPDLYLGVLYLCTLPSTVQSSIALTAIARGNVPAAVCSASASNFVGIFLTPLLVGLLVMHGVPSRSPLDAMLAIVVELLLPFVAGQFARRWIGHWIARRAAMLRLVDQGSILLVVYSAFSDSVAHGLWQQLAPSALLKLALVCCLLLALALSVVTFISRRCGFSKEDEIAIVFCGSKKSLATGVPMAKLLFASSSLGTIVLPLMLFHQLQLMAGALLAQRFARRA